MNPGLRHLRERFDAFLLDLDHTTLDVDGNVTPRTRAALDALRDLDFTVVLCTGRSIRQCADVYRAAGCTDPMVAYDGDWIGRPGEPPISVRFLDRELVAGLGALERSARFVVRHLLDEYVTAAVDHPVQHFMRERFDHLRFVDALDELPPGHAVQVRCYFHETDVDEELGSAPGWDELPETVRAAVSKLVLPLRVFERFRDAQTTLFQVSARSYGKAEALTWLAADRGIPAERVIAVGDQVNDLSMIRAAGLGVAVENADPMVIAAADLVIGHYAAEAFAEWIEGGAATPSED